MGDPLSVASALIAIVTATIQASKALYETVQSFKSHQSTVERLTRELAALTTVLLSLEDLVASDERPFIPLKQPLSQCCQACRDFKLLIDRSTRRSGPLKTSFRDWAQLRYMSSDVDDFTKMLAGYKATINIALADANLRTSKVTLGVLNDYKSMIHDTKHDLELHLGQINSKLESLQSQQQRPTTDTDPDASVQRMQGDKNSTEKCIEYCKQLLAQINAMQFEVVRVEPAPGQGPSKATITPRGVTYPDARALSTFKDCSAKISEALDDLEKYRMKEAVEGAVTLRLDPTLDRERLLGEASSIQQRLDFCDGASQRASQIKVHVLEDIKVGDDSSQVCVSTLGDLFKVRGATAGHGSFQFFGSTTEFGLSEILKALNQNQSQFKRNEAATAERLVHASTSGSDGKPPAT